jgi:transposase-like protein
MNETGLYDQQIAVIDALSSGVTVTEAATLAGVHRNTINNWRRTIPAFQQALADAQDDRAMLVRERAEALVDLAYKTLEALLADPATPASVRLKAALYIIDKVSTPPQPVHQPAQSAQSAQSDQWKPEPLRREHPKNGRNQPCPCNSGRKYKYCCLNKPLPRAA